MRYFHIIRISILALVICLSGLHARGQTDLAFYSNIKLTATFTPRWELQATEGLRIYTDDPVMRRYSSAVQLSYGMTDWLKGGVSVTLMRNHTLKQWDTRTKLFAYLQQSVAAGPITLLFYERYQQIYYTTGIPHNEFILGRITAQLPLCKGAYRPWIAAQARWRLSSGNGGIPERWRFTAGNRFRLDDRDFIDLYAHCIVIRGAKRTQYTFAPGVDYIFKF